MDQKTTMHVEFQTDSLADDATLRERIRCAVRDVLFLEDFDRSHDRGTTQNDVVFTDGWMCPEEKHQAKVDALAAEIDQLDAVKARYIADTAVVRASLNEAVNGALESNVTLENFEGLLNTLQAFENMLYLPMTDPVNHSQANFSPLEMVDESPAEKDYKRLVAEELE